MPKTIKVRVISGAFRGRLLTYPGERLLRPTMQRTKSSTFESLAGAVQEAVFVDLYAAAGGIGIEALSRGARRVHFVESDDRAVRYLKENLAMLGISAGRYRIHAVDVLEFISSGALAAAEPDVVFADPPYAEADLMLLLELLAGIDYPPSAVLIIEHSKSVRLGEPKRLRRVRTRTFGQTCLTDFVGAGGSV